MGVIRVDSRDESWMTVNQVDNMYRGIMNGSDSGWQYRGLMNGSDSGWQYRGLMNGSDSGWQYRGPMNGSDSGRQETGIMNVIDSGWWCTQRRHEWEHFRLALQRKSWINGSDSGWQYRGLINGSDSGWQYRGLMNGSDSGWQYRGLMNGSDSGRQETGIMNVIDSGWWCTQRRHEWEHFRLALQRKSWIRWKPFQDKRLLGYCSLCVLIDPHWGSLISSVPCLVGCCCCWLFGPFFTKSTAMSWHTETEAETEREGKTEQPDQKLADFFFFLF